MTAVTLGGRRGGIWYDRFVGSNNSDLDAGWDIVAAERVDGLGARADDLDQATMAADFLAECGARLFDLRR